MNVMVNYIIVIETVWTKEVDQPSWELRCYSNMATNTMTWVDLCCMFVHLGQLSFRSVPGQNCNIISDTETKTNRVQTEEQQCVWPVWKTDSSSSSTHKQSLAERDSWPQNKHWALILMTNNTLASLGHCSAGWVKAGQEPVLLLNNTLMVYA